jgi:hypothetical protein
MLQRQNLENKKRSKSKEKSSIRLVIRSSAAERREVPER